MSTSAFIAGDWGTTHLRLYLCTARGEVLHMVEGPGAVAAKGNFSGILNALVAQWQHESTLPILLCGMVGSSIGWRQVEPVKCPALPNAIAQAVVAVESNQVRIVPGLSCRNIMDAPDFMRGEESQILGVLQLHPALRHGRHLLCMPGTHTKWVIINDSRIEHFLTAPTGELFSLLCKHSVLVHDVQPAINSSTTEHHAFKQGVEEIKRFPQAGLLNYLFECRSRRLSGELPAADAESFLSGLLIASDVRNSLALMSSDGVDEVIIIGAHALGNLYLHALSAMNRRAMIVSGDTAVRAGLTQVYQLLYPQGSP